MELPELDSETIDRVLEMAWEDRTTFEAIELQFGLAEPQVIASHAPRDESLQLSDVARASYREIH